MFVIMSCASKVYTRPDCCHIVTRSWVVVEDNGVGEGDEEGVGVGIIMHVYFLPGLPLLFSGTAPALCNCMQCFSSSKWRWKQLFGVPGTAGCLFEKGRGLGNYGTNWTIILGSSFFFLFSGRHLRGLFAAEGAAAAKLMERILIGLGSGPS